MALIVSEQMQQRKKLKFQRELKRHLSSFTSDELKTNIQNNFSLSKMSSKLGEILDKYVKIQKHIELKLPQIKKL